MKLAYVVFNISKAGFDEKEGLVFGSSALANNHSYSMTLFKELEDARKAAKALAVGGTIGIIFELSEAMLIKPTPVEIITVRKCDCEGREHCGECIRQS